MKLGDRVVVRIANAKEWAHGAPDALNGVRGTVSCVRQCLLLVDFDTPVKPWWTHGSPSTAFWFEAKDLAGKMGLPAPEEE